MFDHTGPIKSLLGVALSLGLTATAPLFAALPPWFGEVEKWGGVTAVLVGVFATAMIGIGQCMKNIKTWQELRDHARKEMQEIKAKNEEQVCLNRRLTGICPMTKLPCDHETHNH